MKRFYANCARAAEILLGLVFVAGAVLKAAKVGENSGINLFMRQILSYGVLPQHHLLLAAVALGTLAIETALGMALVLAWRVRGVALLAVPALLVFFTCLIIYGWVFHNLADCGCFGPIEMSPGVSIAKNGVLLLLWLIAWAGRDDAARLAATSKRQRRAFAKAIVCLACAIGLPVYAGSTLRPLAPGAFARFTVEAGGQPWDLGAGEYFVAIYNSTCEHCMDSVEQLNEWVGQPGFPRIVALCWGNEESIEEFRLLTEPAFPIHAIDEATFWELVGLVPPRFYHIRDGASLQVWDEEWPAVEAVLSKAGAS
ncbi:MAG TPA: hypothetical protein HPP83_06175 [Candidatus Hydrogenedentes bacterium]|nr:hypothetical protein [Candidatus Hydrogenedentota bacterium]